MSKKSRTTLSKRRLIRKTFILGAAAVALASTLHTKIIPSARARMDQINRSRIEHHEKNLQFKKELSALKKSARKQNLAQIREYRKSMSRLQTNKLHTNYPQLALLSSKSLAEVREYLLNNADSLAQKYRPISKKQALKNKKVLEPLIIDAAKRHEVNPKTMIKLFQAESGWDPYAIGRGRDIGLGQLTPVLWNSKTHKQYNCNPLNPIENIEVATKYFSYLKNMFGNEKLALTAYNQGETSVRRNLQRGQSVSQIVNSNPNKYAVRVLGQKI